MKRLATMTGLLGLCLTTLAGDTEAGLFRRRAGARTTVRYSATAVGCPAGAVCPAARAPAYPAPQARVGVPPDPLVLGAVNGVRARYGLPPAGWDARLAAAAATNAGVHAPGSSGGGMQAWAGTRDPAAAVAMWAADPPHLAILLHARVIGASPCPSGFTLNAI
jgi:hypothetical protein